MMGNHDYPDVRPFSPPFDVFLHSPFLVFCLQGEKLFDPLFRGFDNGVMLENSYDLRSKVWFFPNGWSCGISCSEGFEWISCAVAFLRGGESFWTGPS